MNGEGEGVRSMARVRCMVYGVWCMVWVRARVSVGVRMLSVGEGEGVW